MTIYVNALAEDIERLLYRVDTHLEVWMHRDENLSVELLLNQGPRI